MTFVCPKCKAEFEAEKAPASCPRCGTSAEQGSQYFGDFELIGLVGRSDISLLYRARSLRTGRIIALKVLVTEGGASAEELSRLAARAQRASGLSHENIAQLVRVGEVEGVPYTANEFIEGKPLGRFLAESRLSVSEGLSLAESTAQGLEYAHSEGAVHGNLKPNNMIIDNLGNPKLTDFGLAREMRSLADTGRKLAVPYYVSPEQLRDEEPDARSDIWGLGAVVYHMLCGKPPFEANDLPALLRKIASEAPRPPRFLNPRLPRTADAVISRCLAKDPDARYQSMRELIRELDATLSRRPVAAVEGPGKVGLLRRLRRRFLAVAAVVLVAAGAAAGGWLASRTSTGVSPVSRGRKAVERSKRALERGLLGEAEEYARRAAKADRLEKTDRAFVRYCLGLCDEDKSDWTGAVEEYALLLELLPGDPDVLSRLGKGRYFARDYAGAAEAFEKELIARGEGDPLSGEASLRLGFALWRLGELDEAAGAFEKARGYGSTRGRAGRAREDLKERGALAPPH